MVHIAHPYDKLTISYEKGVKNPHCPLVRHVFSYTDNHKVACVAALIENDGLVQSGAHTPLDEPYAR